MFFITCFSCSIASAQYNYYRLSVGGGAGAAMAFGDLKKNFIRPTGLITFDYNLTPFSSVGLEIQKGFLSGGDSVDVSIDQHLRFYKNSFTSVILGGKVQLGQFIDFESSNLLYAIRGFYVGTGIGMMNSSMTEINRSKVNPDGSNYVFPGVDKGSDLFVPINTGISFNIVDQWRFTKFSFNINYQMNMVFGESLDGYNDPPAKFKNMHGDFYGVATVGFRYFFGTEGLY